MERRIDWQAYLDGSLPPDLAREAERLLREDPRVRRELQALKGFIGQVRSSALSEFVPAGRFESLMPRRRKPNRAFRKSVFSLVPLAVLAGAWHVTGQDPARLDRSPVLATSRTEDPAQAATFAASYLMAGAPKVALDGRAQLCTTRAGAGWAAYDYRVGEDRYSLYISRDATPFRKRPQRTIEGERYVSSHGVGWEQKGLAFYVAGPEPGVRTSLACAARKEIAAQALEAETPYCGTP
jgi:hypothetical protein